MHGGAARLLVTICIALGGCVSAPEPRSLTVEEVRHGALFAAAIEVLRDERFVVDRKDRRFGVVTTKPRTASTALEPWHRDHASAAEALFATLNHRRWVVRVELGPAPPDAEDRQTRRRIEVTARLEQRQHPERPLVSAAVRPVTDRGRRLERDAPLTEHGFEPPFWREAGRDRALEARLAAAIAERAAAPGDPH